MGDMTDPQSVEQRFFGALVDADVPALEDVLADDFVLVDVMGGSEIPKPALLSAVGSGQLVFEHVHVEGSRVRLYGTAAVINGSTEMSGRFGDIPWAAQSRYTHVFIQQDGRWRMVAAQGTQIASQG